MVRDGMIINEICPIDERLVDQLLTSDYLGMRVAFCGMACKDRWDRLSEEQKRERIAELTNEE